MTRLAERWRPVARRLRHPFAARGLILMYHRVVDLPSDPQLLSVTPQHFAEHLEALRQYARPMHLSHLAQTLTDNKLPSHSVVVTFDDGYADNLHNAKPLLERYDIPATVFVTSGHVGHQREFWWDELDRVLLRPGTVPRELCLRINRQTYHWTLGEAASYTEVNYERYRDWHIERPDDPTLRQSLYRSLYHVLHALAGNERQVALDALATWVGAGLTGRATHRTLTTDEVSRLAEGGLIEVGAHTVTHPVLSALSPTMQQAEVCQGKVSLEEILNRPVTSFAYPHGAMTAQTVDLVRDTGFACACASVPDVVWPSDNCFKLPRHVVRDWDGDTFANQLRRWLDR